MGMETATETKSAPCRPPVALSLLSVQAGIRAQEDENNFIGCIAFPGKKPSGVMTQRTPLPLRGQHRHGARRLASNARTCTCFPFNRCEEFAGGTCYGLSLMLKAKRQGRDDSASAPGEPARQAPHSEQNTFKTLAYCLTQRDFYNYSSPYGKSINRP